MLLDVFGFSGACVAFCHFDSWPGNTGFFMPDLLAVVVGVFLKVRI
jgi:hypothetical protein